MKHIGLLFWLILLLSLLTSSAYAATLISGFESGSYTVNPTWTVSGGTWTVGTASKYVGLYGITGSDQIYTQPASAYTDNNYSYWLNTRTIPAAGNHGGLILSGTTNAIWAAEMIYVETVNELSGLILNTLN